MPSREYRWVRAETDRGVAVLRIMLPELHGDGETELLHDELCAAVADLAVPNAVLDCRDVTFVTSLGIAGLLKFRNACKRRGGQVALCNLTPLIAEVFVMTKVVSANASADVPFLLAADPPAAVGKLLPGG